MSYLLTELDKGVPLSKAVEGASAENLLEPDPPPDLDFQVQKNPASASMLTPLC